ncbi:hypothetical protein [Suttonella ornithocola]|uniref:Uncharacterized protein n=1 Tax=Suttonella ornithocola TaxID=279832 RepID=A0A380MWW8_9GAMM|nr:hypothetical protein [Suttonella ornithocola]SUO96772.1 Uncharacterised protein [Suttonella ornithocola]
MANLSNIHQLIEQLNQNDRSAIIALIDLKMEGDMQQVLNKLDVMAHNINAKFSAMDAKFEAKLDAVNARFDAVDARFDALEKGINTRFDALEKGTNARFIALENSIASIRWWNMTAIGFIGLLFVFLRFFPS